MALNQGFWQYSLKIYREEDFMRQSKNKKREVTAALYVRLSRDDNLEGDS